MRSFTAGLITVTCLALIAGTAMVTARGQQQRPGEIGENRVLVDNHRPDQAVPVIVQRIDQTSAIGVRAVRQSWEYRVLNLPVGQDPARLLTTAGLDGWEAVGFHSVSSGMTVLLKRPR
jgi:hypothetical protein